MPDNDTVVAERERPVLAETLRHHWYAVARSEQVADRPLAVRLLDQPLVLWRAHGQLAAFYDLCIHRGTPLSLGWVEQDQLVCATTVGLTVRMAPARASRRCRRSGGFRPRRGPRPTV